MIIRTVVVGAMSVVLGVALPRMASAQQSTVESQTDVDLGVNTMRIRNQGVTEKFSKGLHAGASYRISHLISVLGDVSADYHALPGYTKHIYAYGGGVRFNSANPHARIDPLAQIMVGWAQDNGTGDGHHNYYPVVAPAVGVDLGLFGGVAARVRVDFPLWMTFGDVYKGTRVSVGLTCRMGHRKAM